MISLQVRNLFKSFGRRVVLQDVNFSLHPGDSLVITGKNGSGKTTLLRIICGFLSPTKGEVTINSDGEKLDKQRRQKKLGLVAPDLMLYDELTALENLRFLSQVQGLPFTGPELKQKIQDMGLEKREDDLVGSFSFGMKQRLKYASALLNQPEILLLDEPNTNLDEQGLTLVEKIITQQKRKGILILATNDEREKKYGEKILHLGS